MTNAKHSRRTFLSALAGTIAPLALGGRVALAAVPGYARRRHGPLSTQHPDPRPGIDASLVLPADRVVAEVRELFDHIREIPHVVDGIRCQCGCAELPGMYSLLSCYEDSGMAQHCVVCQGIGELAYQMHGEGRSLDDIRAAVDRRSW